MASIVLIKAVGSDKPFFNKRECALIYEIRVYEAVEGRADAMRRRFREHAADRFFPVMVSNWSASLPPQVKTAA